MRVCSKCAVTKAVSEFQRSAATKHGLQSACKTYRSAVAKAYYLANKERIDTRVRESLDREEFNRKRKERRAQNRESEARKARELRAANVERIRANARRWSKRNRPTRAASDARRYAAKVNATPRWADQSALRRFYEEANRLSQEMGDLQRGSHRPAA